MLFQSRLLFFTASISFAYDWSTNPGDGSPGNPYQVSRPEQLNAIGSDPSVGLTGMQIGGTIFRCRNEAAVTCSSPGDYACPDGVAIG